MTTASTPQGTVRMRRQGQTLTFQVAGLGRMQQSLPMRRLAEKAFADGVTTLRIDLRHCTYVDSTFLGTLLLLHRNVRHRAHCSFFIVSPSVECRQLFKQMGVEECLPALAEPEPTSEGWIEVGCEAEVVEVFERNVVQAHQELAKLGGPIGRAFEGVANCLAKDLERRDPP